MNTSRRHIVALSAGAAALSLAGCSNQQVDIAALEAKIADIITQVQQGVKGACNLVPAASSVLAVLQAIAGANAGVAAFLAAVQEGITFISQVCPAPSALGAPIAPRTVTVKDKEVPITFY